MGGSKPKKDKSEEKRQERIAAGTQKVNQIFGAYDKPFFDKRAADYEGWAMPQVEQQYADAQKELMYALARQYGSTNTSEAAQRQARLAKDFGLRKTEQTEQGLAQANQARGQVEDARTRVLQQLAATADPAAAAQAATHQNETLTHIDPYSSLGELFANVTEGLAASSYPYGIMGQPAATTPGYSGAGSKIKGKSYTVAN